MMNEGMTNGDASAAYATTTYQPAASAAPSAGASLHTVTQDAPVCPVIQPQLADERQVASKQAQQPHHDHQKQELPAFWSGQLAEIQQTTKFKNHNLPLARIKKIMKADSDVQRISSEAPPMVFAKACEMFIQELTLRGWHHAQENKRRTLQKNDITEAIARTEVFDFMVPSDEKGTSVQPNTTAVQEEDDDDPYANYYECDCFSCPSSPDEPDLRNVTCDDPRYYTYIHEYYSL